MDKSQMNYSKWKKPVLNGCVMKEIDHQLQRAESGRRSVDYKWVGEIWWFLYALVKTYKVNFSM